MLIACPIPAWKEIIMNRLVRMLRRIFSTSESVVESPVEAPSVDALERPDKGPKLRATLRSIDERWRNDQVFVPALTVQALIYDALEVAGVPYEDIVQHSEWIKLVRTVDDETQAFKRGWFAGFAGPKK